MLLILIEQSAVKGIIEFATLSQAEAADTKEDASRVNY